MLIPQKSSNLRPYMYDFDQYYVQYQSRFLGVSSQVTLNDKPNNKNKNEWPPLSHKKSY